MTGQSAVEVFKLGAAMPKGGAPVEKKSDDSPNFPKTPSLPLTGLREVECCFFFFPPVSDVHLLDRLQGRALG